MCVCETALLAFAGILSVWTGVKAVQILIDNIKQRRK